MSDPQLRAVGWTVETLKEHYDALLFQRDEALKATLTATDKALAVFAETYRADKANQNEWRGTINDILSRTGGASRSTKEAIGYAVGFAGFVVGIASLLLRAFGK